MKTIQDAFKNGKAFIAFLTCGDPDLDTTRELIRTLSDAGADLIELGIPFSDPVAEGPVIQAANVRALSGGVTTDKIFDMLDGMRGEVDVPLVFMTYANVVFSYGTERFLARAQAAGICGLILPDVPFEEKEDFAPACVAYGVELVSLIAPTSHERIGRIARQAQGFIYCVSSLGVTGEQRDAGTAVGDMVAQLRAVTQLPCAVGFGISTPQQAVKMAALADGVIVGSAIVRLVGQYGKAAAGPVYQYVKSMKDAICTVE
mgnify:CR=1 FL=1